MTLHPVDLTIIAAYLVLNALIGFYVRKKATKAVGSYFLADRNVGAASFTAMLGKGKILFHSIPGVVSGLNGESNGLHPLMLKRLIANSLRYLHP